MKGLSLLKGIRPILGTVGHDGNIVVCICLQKQMEQCADPIERITDGIVLDLKVALLKVDD